MKLLPRVRMRRVAVVVCSLFLACLLALWLAVSSVLRPVAPEGGKRTFVVLEGWTLRDAASALEREGLIRSEKALRLLARVRGGGRGVRAGEYSLSPAMEPGEVLSILTSGRVLTHTVTIPEGLTVAQTAEVLERKDLADKQAFLALFRDHAFLEKHGLPGPTLEGYLYPDTYRFARGLSPERIAETMIRRFWEVVEPLKERARERDLGLRELVTLASVVEKETGKAEERPIIASVFLNRLERGMRLQSDPTVIYGMDEFNGNITRKDLETKTPYNTYRLSGLPPGPIANPGKDALRAVLYPSETDFLYFVSKNDGSHKFSRTLSEHNRAVRRYQLRGGGREGKTS